MRRILIELRSPALIASVLVLPFVSLELMAQRTLDDPFPFALFGTLWLLPVTLIFALRSIGREWRQRVTGRTLVMSLLPKSAFALLVAWVWISLVVDQMPCFLGVPNCD